MARGESVTVDTCLFEDSTNSGEFVLLKIGGMVWKNCSFVNCSGYFQVRTGGHCEVRSCWFENVTNRYFGKDHLVIGNRYLGTDNLWIPCGNADYDSMVADGAGALYAAAEECEIIGNRLDAGHIDIGRFWAAAGGDPADVPASNNLLEENTRDSGGDAHAFHNGSEGHPLTPGSINTTINATTSVQYTPAVKLTAADVGLDAPDPLCPWL